MTRTLPVTEFRNNLPTLISNAQKKLDEYIITVNGKPAAILMSIDEYESMQETFEIMTDKKLMKDIEEAEEEIKQGKAIPWEQAKKELGWE